MGRKLFALGILSIASFVACFRVEDERERVTTATLPPVLAESPTSTSTSVPSPIVPWTRPTDCVPPASSVPQAPLGNTFDDDRRATVAWRPVTSPPVTNEYHPQLASLPDGRAIRFGGQLDVYDPDLDRWTTAAPMPAGLGRVAATSMHNGMLQVFTVRAGAMSVASYDVANDRWDDTSSLLVENLCEVQQVVAMGSDHFFAFGTLAWDEARGACPGDAPRRAFMFDATTRTWSEKQPLPDRGWVHHYPANEDLVLGIHLADAYGPLQFHLYDRARDTWSSVPKLSFEGADFQYVTSTPFALPNGDFMVPGQNLSPSHPVAPRGVPWARFDSRCRWFVPAPWSSIQQSGGVPIALDDHRVLLAGGFEWSPGRGLHAALANLIYDARLDRWSGVSPARSSVGHAAAKVKTGVLLTGGSPGGCGTFCTPPKFKDAFVISPE